MIMNRLLSELYKTRIQELAGIYSKDVIYHETLSSALDYAVTKANERGYEVDQNDVFDFGVGGIPYGTTKRGMFDLTANGIPQKKKLNVQLYRMDSGKYELNFYIQ